MTPILFPADVLLLTVFGAAVLYSVRVRRHPLQLQRWRAVFRQPGARLAAFILLPYVLVAVLDCIRISASPRPVSVLDIVLTELRTSVETTYSAPFASHALVAETRMTKEGYIREYPRLRHGGRHLDTPSPRKSSDISQRLVVGAVAGLILAVAVGTLFGFLPRGALTATIPGRRRTLIALVGVCLVAGILWQLAPVYHVLGTDKVGNDVFYQSLKSVRTALVLGTVSTLVTLPLAIGLGLAAGYFGGWVDDCIQYLYAVVSSVPSVLLIAAGALAMDLWLEGGVAAGMIGSFAASSDFRLLCLCVVLGLTGWTSLCRLVRGEVLKLRASEFTLASRALGTAAGRIILRHLLPNVMPLVLVTTVLDFSALVLAEAVLTYINIGIDPATPSWGNMINAARLELTREPVVWWSLAAAFLGMLGLILPVNLLADIIRDEFDPRSRSEEGRL